MLKSLKITNFYSIGSEQSISLEVSSKDMLDDSTSKHISGSYLNDVACVIGSNASGKTNILKALSFFAWFIQESYSSFKIEDSIPINPHKLHPTKPTIFEIEFYEKEILYHYYLKLNNKEVLEEKLSKTIKIQRSRKTTIFHLTRNSKTVNITHDSLEISPSDLERIKKRPNISFLSSLIDLGYLPNIKFFTTINHNITFSINSVMRKFGRLNSFYVFMAEDSIARSIQENMKLKNELLTYLKEIDISIENLIPNNETKLFKIDCTHKSNKGDFILPFFEESNGTQRIIFILSIILPILSTGGLVILDEIENDLHPHLIKKIISLFENKETNPNNAQIIFSTHQHILLNDRTKTQIFITEKNAKHLETEIYRLDDIEGIRNDENYFHKYMAGIYGGTPHIKWI